MPRVSKQDMVERGDIVVRFDDQGRRLCTARAKTTGEDCNAPAMRGQVVCRKHGGSTKSAKAKAQLRLAQLVDPAVATLAREMVNADKSTDRQRAANSILDRAGFGRQTKFDVTDAKDILKQRLLDMRENDDEEIQP